MNKFEEAGRNVRRSLSKFGIPCSNALKVIENTGKAMKMLKLRLDKKNIECIKIYT